MEAHDIIARILRTDKDNVAKLEGRLSALTGKQGVLEKIVFENGEKIKDRLSRLGVSHDVRAKWVYDALIQKIEENDKDLCAALGSDMCASHHNDFQIVVDAVSRVRKVPSGFFVKKEKLISFLETEPPKKVMEFLGYSSVQDMLAHEDLFEVMSALRFIEGNEWLNKSFFVQYERLTPDDFEEREIEIRVLSEKWGKYARQFVMKKWHNVSHLKEFGAIFIIPVSLGIPGETLRTMSLVFHYTHEIPFYSDIIRTSATRPETFAAQFISLLRGDTYDTQFPKSEKMQFLVVQRYLAKDDENDWRLFAPRINPEALHWTKAEENLASLGTTFGHSGHELKFWSDLGWVGDFFKDETGNSLLVSFDLVDTVMSLVKKHEEVKFLYHHQEALWNKIFMEYFSRTELEEYSKRNILRGWFEL